MPFYADLHIHSKYSRACSRDCDLEHLAWWARRKGVTVVGSGDFTHPAWFEHLRENLEPAEPGLFRLREELDRGVERTLPASCRGPVRFMLSVEISTIYKRAERTRKVHHLVYVPDLEAAERFNRRLGRIGNIASDGRPILGLDSRDLLEITLESGPGSYLVPAHAWTPWFAVLGSKSGFDAVAHSPPMLGREACVFSSEMDYFSMRRALETGEGYGGTVEFFPEEGKYHLDGHRKCDVCMEPTETRRRQGRCPVCGKPLTVGVLHRVEELADRPEGARLEGAAGFRNLIQLPEIVGETLRVGPKSKAVAAQIDALTERLGPELGILTTAPLDEVARVGSSLLAEALGRLREGRVLREAGYDGEYGVIRLFERGELERPASTAVLFEPPPQVAATPKARRAWPAAEDASAVPAPPPAPAPTPETPTTGQGGSLPPPLALEPQPGHAEGGASRGERSSPLDHLDPDQRAAAAVEGPLLIVAGPGTGKTRALTHRIAHLVAERGVPPGRCLAITFTRRAAEELRQRLGALLGERADGITVATFHSLGLAIVAEQRAALGLGPGVRVADEVERLGVLREVSGASEAQARRLAAEVSRRKRVRAARDPSAAPAPAAEEVDDLLDHYDKALRERDLVDFDDLIALPVTLLGGDHELAARYRGRWGWISVDEYQDVDELQYRLLRLLTTPDGNLCAIGDPDQAIYGFRGADVGFFLRFRQDFPGAATAQLTRNYRSSAAIVDGAVQAIAPGTLVRGRVLRASGGRTAPPRLRVHRAASEAAEAEFVVHTIERLLGGSTFFSFDSGRVDGDGGSDLSFADVAVLYRTDAQSPALVEALSRAGMPFQKRSHDRLADLPGVPPVLRALRQAPAPGAEVAGTTEAPEADRSVLARVRRAAREAGVVEVEVDPLLALAARCGDDLDRFLGALALGAQVDTWDPRADRVSLLTLHAAKGLEFPVVFLVGCEDGLLPLRFGAVEPAASELAEERRLLFVGMTRARSHLYLSWAARRARHGMIADSAPSPFLAAIDEALLERLAGSGGARRQAEPKGDQLSLLE